MRPSLEDGCLSRTCLRRTSVDALLVCGDGAGVRGAAAAALAGKLTGLTAAHDLGHLDRTGFEAQTSPRKRRLQKLLGLVRRWQR